MTYFFLACSFINESVFTNPEKHAVHKRNQEGKQQRPPESGNLKAINQVGGRIQNQYVQDQQKQTKRNYSDWDRYYEEQWLKCDI